MILNVRSYSKQDSLDDIFDLHDDALKAIGCIPLDRKWNDDLNDINANYIENSGDFLIIEKENIMVGFGALKFIEKGLFEIKRMRICPQWQRHGLGKMLLVRLLETAKVKGAKRIVLDTTTLQVGAQRLYEKFGFMKYGETQIHGFDVILYELFIDDL